MKKMSKKEIYQRICAELLAMADDEPLGRCYQAHKANIADLEKQYAFQQGVQPTVATCSACGRELLPDGSCPNDDPSTLATAANANRWAATL